MKKTTWTRLFWSSSPLPADAELTEQEVTELAAEAAERPAAAEPVPPTDDPQLDQVLIAFEAMKAAMPAPQLAIAIRATAKAIAADPVLIGRAITQRLASIDASVAEVHRTTTEREAARNVELAELAAATEKLQKTTADERAAASNFEAKARDEAARLVALRDVLGAK
jgi:hypothetical protein